MKDRTTGQLLKDALDVSQYDYHSSYAKNKLIAELSAKLREREWQPIDMALKDEDAEPIYCCIAGSKIPYLAQWDFEDGWVSWNMYFERTHKKPFEPTHFTSLHTPPKKED